MLGGSSITDVDSYPNKAGQTGNKALTIPRDANGGPKEGAVRSQKVDRMKKTLAAKLAATEKLRRLARQVKMIDTTEGIRIDLVDDADFAMFRLGTTILTPEASELLRVIGQTLAPEPGGLSIRGHTDATPWRDGTGANNWSLSAGRAEATRQALIRTGIRDERYRRIEGVADRELLVANDPADPRNRRISILLMR